MPCSCTCSLLSAVGNVLTLQIELPSPRPESFSITLSCAQNSPSVCVEKATFQPLSTRITSEFNDSFGQAPLPFPCFKRPISSSTPIRSPIRSRKQAKISYHRSPAVVKSLAKSFVPFPVLNSLPTVHSHSENEDNSHISVSPRASNPKINSSQASSLSNHTMHTYRALFQKSRRSLPRNRFLKARLRRWSEKSIQRSLAILFATGSKGYNILRRYGLGVPARSTLSAWSSHFKFKPGIDDSVFDQIGKEIAKFNSFQRDIALLFDETAIHPKSEIDANLHAPLGQTTLPASESFANKALAVMIRGISSRYKRILAYHFTSSATSVQDLKDFLFACIENLERIGLKVRIVISDMGGLNQALWKKLGLAFSKDSVKASISNPFAQERKIFFCADIPHLLKNLANALRTSDFVAPNGRYISFDSITTLFELQKHHLYQLAEKISPTHLNPNTFQKMKVGVAAQTLSNSVASALFVLAKEFSNIPDSDIILNTANFITLADKWFSVLNSRTPALAFSFTHPDILAAQLSLVSRFSSIVSRAVFLSRPSHKPVQNGIAFAMDAIIGLVNDLKDDGYYYFIPGRISQDALESFFSVLRARFQNPSASEFHYFCRCAFLSKLDDYVEDDIDQYPPQGLANSPLSHSLLHRTESNPSASCAICPNTFTDTDPFSPVNPTPDLLPRIEGLGFLYVIGALVHSCFKFSKSHPNRICAKCINSLSTDFTYKLTHTETGKHLRKIYEPPQKYYLWYHLIHYRQNATLIVPSDSVVDFFLQAEMIFRKLIAVHGKEHSNKSHYFDLISARISTISFQTNCMFKPVYCDIQSLLLKKYLNIRFSIQTRFWNRTTKPDALIFASKSAFLAHQRICSSGLSRWNTARASLHPAK